MGEVGLSNFSSYGSFSWKIYVSCIKGPTTEKLLQNTEICKRLAVSGADERLIAGLTESSKIRFNHH